ncbi:AAA family ATPase [Bacillus marinisedimentorum]|uniref:AAA family ATPase n=1 Tax=Bacillus marinisedimentorum TaxID=1821260 RepID=UPI0008721CCE|nr:AAA family ATPase [Bacillus marinisedimentorum]
MRPIKLVVSGLHSFREPQTVQFDSLCDAGVFGIFGPTGSGKSSLLDAMTLALYGKVERAANNTQGILNHAEDELHVSFTFQLKDAAVSKQYTVERRFKRTGDVTVKTSVCRLIDESDDEKTIVMADKNSEVNREIMDLLGLTIDDFTRAVVLPQGKFAEFLSLKGADRRQMLQRLFNLEKYGDELNRNIRSKIGRKKTAYEKIISEQAGLGDASDDALKEAEKAASEADAFLKKCETEYEKAETLYQQQKEKWELQNHREKLLKERENERYREEEMKALQIQLEHARMADRLSPYLDEYETAASRKSKWQHEKEQAAAAFEEAQSEYGSKENQYKQAKESREKEEPVLTVKVEQLKQAAETEKEMDILRQEINGLEQKLKETGSRIDKEKTELEDLQDKYKRGQAKQQRLKEELETAAVSPKEREDIRRANESRTHIQIAEKNKQEAEKEHADKKAAWEESNKKHERLLQEEQSIQKKGTALFKTLETQFHHVSERLYETEKLESYLLSRIEEKEAELDQARITEIASGLAASLKIGEACPVCGSIEHPAPVHGKVQSAGLLQQDMKELKGTIDSIRKESRTLHQFKLQYEQLSERMSEALSPERIEPSSAQKEVEPLVELDRGLSVEQLAETAFRLSTETKALKQDFLETEENVKAAARSLTEISRRLQQSSQTVEELEKSLEEKRKKLDSAENEIEEKRAFWSKEFPAFSLQEAVRLQQGIMEKDSRAEELKVSIEKSVRFLEDWETDIEKRKQNLTDLQLKVAEQKSNLSYKKESYEKAETALKRQAGDRKPSELLEETSGKLDRLKKEETFFHEAFEKTRKQLQEAEKRLSAASHSLKDCDSRLRETEEKWLRVLNDSPFTRVEEVKEAKRDEKEQQQWQAEVDQFREKVNQIEHEIGQLNEKIGTAALTVEEWNQTQEHREIIKKKVNAALQDKGEKMKWLSVLQENHSRYETLDEQRIEVEKELEKLGKLQQVFRGNQFVEYIAEEQLIQVAREASERLGQLTRQRYAIEVDSAGGFVIRDDANGGVRRPVSTLSGGETFLTSLALALSLSSQIQLRGQFPLQFFFLDEGFGTLDHELLDTVMTSLEKLQSSSMAIGVISHVQELRERMPRKLIVKPAEPSGNGSVVFHEMM